MTKIVLDQQKYNIWFSAFAWRVLCFVRQTVLKRVDGYHIVFLWNTCVSRRLQEYVKTLNYSGKAFNCDIALGVFLLNTVKYFNRRHKFVCLSAPNDRQHWSMYSLSKRQGASSSKLKVTTMTLRGDLFYMFPIQQIDKNVTRICSPVYITQFNHSQCDKYGDWNGLMVAYQTIITNISRLELKRYAGFEAYGHVITC